MWQQLTQHFDSLQKWTRRYWWQGQQVLTVVARRIFLRVFSVRVFERTFSWVGIQLRKHRGKSDQVATVILDEKRRTFLKYALFGGAVFLAGKYTTPVANMLRGDRVLSEKTFQNFKVTETGTELKVMDDDGAELLIIDKESF